MYTNPHFHRRYPQTRFHVRLMFAVLLHFFNVRSAGGNVLLWMTLSLGIGIDLAFYAAEWYARQNCPPVYVSVIGAWMVAEG